MAELDKTISVIESWLKQPVLTPPPINALYDALELLKEHQRIVRCKDCKYGKRLGYLYECDDGVMHEKDFYCKDGKRKEE